MRYNKTDSKEASREYVTGVWAAITTPFTPTGDLDLVGIRSNVVRLVDEFKVSGVFCAGAMGEFWALTSEERRLVVEAVVDAAQGRCRVIAHTGHHSLRETIALTLHAQEVGADFASTFAPYYPPATEVGLYRWFKELCDSTDIGLWLIDTGLCGPTFSLELTETLAKLPNVCGLKLMRGREHYRAVKDRVGDEIVLSEPSEELWLDLIKEGQQTFMSSPAPYLLQAGLGTPMIEYTSAALAGEHQRARDLFGIMQPLRELYQDLAKESQAKGLPPTGWVKAWSARVGFAAGPVRAPLDVSDFDLARINTVLDDVVA